MDIWSLGIIIFNLFSGTFPFWNPSSKSLTCQKILTADLNFDGKWSIISNEIKDLIKKCLEKESEKRIGVEELINDQ